MSNRLKSVERSAFHSQMCRHPVYTLPPNVANLIMASVVGSALNAGFPIAPTLQTLSNGAVIRAIGGAACLSFSVAGGATFTAAKNVSFEIVGRDENWEQLTEVVTLVGTGAASQIFTSKAMFSAVDRVRIIASSGDLVVGESFTIGVGDGNASPALNVLRIPHPLPGAPFLSVAFLPQAGSPLTAVITPVAMTADGKQLVMGVGYTTSSTIRLAAILTALDSRTIENS